MSGMVFTILIINEQLAATHSVSFNSQTLAPAKHYLDTRGLQMAMIIRSWL